MLNVSIHLQQVEYNEGLGIKFQKEYPNWIIVVCFYAAVFSSDSSLTLKYQ